jgi:hypothetical protein
MDKRAAPEGTPRHLVQALHRRPVALLLCEDGLLQLSHRARVLHTHIHTPALLRGLSVQRRGDAQHRVIVEPQQVVRVPTTRATHGVLVEHTAVHFGSHAVEFTAKTNEQSPQDTMTESARTGAAEE